MSHLQLKVVLCAILLKEIIYALLLVIIPMICIKRTRDSLFSSLTTPPICTQLVFSLEAPSKLNSR
jgi:hypothetical protein